MPLPDSTDSLNVPLLRSVVYDKLRELIINGTLAPGERVRDVDLAASLGVSRTPVREALQQLTREGLVEMTANRWTRISPLDIAEADRIYPIVWTLDELAMRLAGPILSSEDLAGMADANQALADAIDERDPAAALEADAEFHRAIAIAAKNPELFQLLDNLRARLQRLEIAYFDAGLGHPSVEEHNRILIALEREDVSAATQAVGENWRNSFERFRLIAALKDQVQADAATQLINSSQGLPTVGGVDID